MTTRITFSSPMTSIGTLALDERAIVYRGPETIKWKVVSN